MLCHALAKLISNIDSWGGAPKEAFAAGEKKMVPSPKLGVLWKWWTMEEFRLSPA